MSNRSGASFSHLRSERAFKGAIKSCHGVVELCRVISQLSTRKDINKANRSILKEFMNRSDWFTHTGTKTENGAIAVAKFFRWWATDNPSSGFWICSREFKDGVAAAFVTAMKNGEAKNITFTIRKLLCTGYAPLFDMLNTPEITSRMTHQNTKSVLKNNRPESNTDKKVAEHTTSIVVLEMELDDVKSEHDETKKELDDIKTKLDGAQLELVQMKRERAAEKKQRAEEKKERATEKKQRAAEKKDHEKTRVLLERALKEMKAMEIHFLKRESGQRRGREEDDDDIKVKKEVKEDNRKIGAKKPAPKKAKK